MLEVSVCHIFRLVVSYGVGLMVTLIAERSRYATQTFRHEPLGHARSLTPYAQVADIDMIECTSLHSMSTWLQSHEAQAKVACCLDHGASVLRQE